MNAFLSLAKLVIPLEARTAIRASKLYQLGKLYKLGAHLFADHDQIYVGTAADMTRTGARAHNVATKRLAAQGARCSATSKLTARS